MLGAISIILGATPLGFIKISLVNATIMHVPVIIGTLIEGPVVGLFVGLIFGGFSMYQAITQSNPLTVIFLDPLVSIFPRLLIAITSYYTYIGLKRILSKRLKSDALSIGIAGAIGSLTNTVGVLSMIYIRHAATYAEQMQIDLNGVKGAIIGIALSQGIPEAIIAVAIVLAVVKSVQKLFYVKH